MSRGSTGLSSRCHGRPCTPLLAQLKRVASGASFFREVRERDVLIGRTARREIGLSED
jgi:hypothetical protein